MPLKSTEQIKLERLIRLKDWKSIRLFFLLGQESFNEEIESKLDPFAKEELRLLKLHYEPEIIEL